MNKQVVKNLREIANSLPDIFELQAQRSYLPWSKLPGHIKESYKKNEVSSLGGLYPVMVPNVKIKINHLKRLKSAYSQDGTIGVRKYMIWAKAEHQRLLREHPEAYSKNPINTQVT